MIYTHTTTYFKALLTHKQTFTPLSCHLSQKKLTGCHPTILVSVGFLGAMGKLDEIKSLEIRMDSWVHSTYFILFRQESCTLMTFELFVLSL